MRKLGLVVAGLALVSLGVGYAWKDQCNHTEWEGDWQYQHYCYNDMVPLWFPGEFTIDGVTVPTHDFAGDKIPFVETFNEYPVLTAFFSYGVAKVTTGLLDYMEVTFVLLTVAGAITTYALWRLDMKPARILFWVAAPTIIIHGLVNWDLLAVALAATGWLAWRRNRPFSAALLLGLGGATKLYPAFFLPFIFLAAWRLGGTKAAGRVAAGGTVGFVLPNFLVYLAAHENWVRMWVFQAERTPDFETPWASFLQPFVHSFTTAYDDPSGWVKFAGLVGLVAMTAALCWFAWRVWKRGLDPLVAGGLLTIVFLLVNKVYSPQYTLWALPILLVAEADWVPLSLFIAADTANFFVRYQLISTSPEGWHLAWQDWSVRLVDWRWLFLLWAAWTILVQHKVITAPWTQRLRVWDFVRAQLQRREEPTAP